MVKVSIQYIFLQARQFSTPGTPGLAGAVTPFPRPQPPEEADLELLLLLLRGITHSLLYSNSEQEYCSFFVEDLQPDTAKCVKNFDQKLSHYGATLCVCSPHCCHKTFLNVKMRRL